MGCVVITALLIGLPGIAASAPLTSVASIPGRLTVTFSGDPIGPAALNTHLAAFDMFSPTPSFNAVGQVGGVLPAFTGNADTGLISANIVSFGTPASASAMTSETTGDPWLAIGYAAFTVSGLHATFSITAYDVDGAVLETATHDFTPVNTSTTAINEAMVFVGVSSSAAKPIYKVEFTRIGDTEGRFDNLTFKPISDAVLRPLADLSFEGFSQTLGPPKVGCDAGIVTLKLMFQYHGADNYERLFYRIAALDAPRTAPDAIGPDLTIYNANLGADAKLTTGETFTADPPICLPNLTRFNLFLDVYGSRMPQAKRVFVTSTRHDGDLDDELPAGRLAGGDAICQARADAALRGGTWTAWLSAPGVSAASHITDSAYVWIDGRTLIAASLADLTDNALIKPISRMSKGGLEQIMFGSAQRRTAPLPPTPANPGAPM
jgi:hypothetical protein